MPKPETIAPTEAGSGSRPEYFDANVLVGPLARRPEGAPEDPEALVAVMDEYGLDRALVTHTYAKWFYAPDGNERLMREIAGSPRLAACWVVLPAASGELPPEETQVAQLLAAGARAARLCPVAHRLTLEPWALEGLVGALAERRVPLLLDMDNVHWSDARPYRFVEWACRTFPHLPLVLLREAQADLRTLAPLLDSCPNLVLETSYFQVHDGIVWVTERWGAHRLVFGTGLPRWDAGLPLTGLSYAGLSQGDLRAVAGGTLRGLLAGCLV